MHSSLAVTIDSLPLGLVAVKFSTRKKFKGTAQHALPVANRRRERNQPCSLLNDPYAHFLRNALDSSPPPSLASAALLGERATAAPRGWLGRIP